MLAWFSRGSGPVLLRNPVFCNFSGGGGEAYPCPPLDPRKLFRFSLLKVVFVCNLYVPKTNIYIFLFWFKHDDFGHIISQSIPLTIVVFYLGMGRDQGACYDSVILCLVLLHAHKKGRRSVCALQSDLHLCYSLSA